MDNTHSQLGPSAAHRWMQCPGSVALEATVPEEEESAYAAEGTRAHEIAAQILNKFPIKDEKNMPNALKEMYNHVRMYTDLVKKECKGLELEIEQKLTLEDIDERLFGTVDAMAYDEKEGILRVFDLKYGIGVEVEVEDNPQLMYYALCSWITHPFASSCILTIVQPRIQGKKIKTIEYRASDLGKFAKRLTAAIIDVDEEPNLFIAGEKQCKWCRASSICPEQSKAFTAITRMEPASPEFSPPEIQTLTIEEASHIYLNKKQIEKFMNDVENRIYKLQMEGTPVPGTKLVMQRKNRIIKSETEARELLRKKGYKVGDTHVKKLKSPSQLEAAGVPKAIVQELTIIPKGKLVLALESDKRIAEEIAPFEFDKLTQGEENGT